MLKTGNDKEPFNNLKYSILVFGAQKIKHNFNETLNITFLRHRKVNVAVNI